MSKAVEFSDRRCTLIFVNIMITCISASFLGTVLTIALPLIIDEFQISVSLGQWMTSGFSLATAIITPLTAFLIIRFRTKRLYLISIVILLVGLCTCAMAPDFSVLMIGRMFQAAGGGVLAAMAQVILLNVYPVERHGQVLGWYGLAMGTAPVLAPTLGGIIMDLSGWRMIFGVSIILMLISFVFAVFVFDDVLDTNTRKFDVVSFILSAFTFGGMTLGVGNISSMGLQSIYAWLPLLIGAAATVAFVRRQMHLDAPFLDLRVFRYPTYTLGVISSSILNFMIIGSSILIPLYAQSVMGYSATVSGLIILPGAIGMALVTPYAGKLYDKFGIKKLFVAGSVILFISSVGMLFVSTETGLWLPVVCNGVRKVAVGCMMMPIMAWTMSVLSKEERTHGTALYNSLRTIAGAVGSAMIVGIMTTAAKNSGGAIQVTMHGLNIAFWFVVAISVVLMGIAVFLVKNNAANKEQV